jgi:hypothetical protein
MLLRARTKWDHLLYSHIPLVYFGVREDYEVNTKYLDKVVFFLHMVGYDDLDIKDYSFDEWTRVKGVFVEAWRQLQL